MSAINRLVQSPEWWFSTIAVALIVNIISALIYDKLKEWLASFTSEMFLIACQIVYATIIFVSFASIQPDDYYARNYLPILGALVTLAVLFDIYLKTRYRFIAMITTLSVFALSLIWDGYNAQASYTLKWLATEFVCSLFVAVGISMLTTSFLRLRERRKQLRDYRG